MVRMIQTFCKGMYLQVEKVRPSTGVADEPDYGVCKTTIGKKHAFKKYDQFTKYWLALLQIQNKLNLGYYCSAAYIRAKKQPVMYRLLPRLIILPSPYRSFKNGCERFKYKFISNFRRFQ